MEILGRLHQERIRWWHLHSGKWPSVWSNLAIGQQRPARSWVEKSGDPLRIVESTHQLDACLNSWEWLDMIQFWVDLKYTLFTRTCDSLAVCTVLILDQHGLNACNDEWGYHMSYAYLQPIDERLSVWWLASNLNHESAYKYGRGTKRGTTDL